MDCPHCKTEVKLIGYECPTHLGGGIGIDWCPECGTTFKHFDFSDRIKEIQIPRREKSNEDTSGVKEDKASGS